MTKGGFNFTNFKGVNLHNTAALGFEMDGGFWGTMAVRSSPDANRAWYLPDMSGSFPIMGTFAVQIPVQTKAFFSTAVTVSGIRIEDAVVVLPNKGASGGYGFDNSTAYILVAAEPTNGAINLYFNNLGNGTGYTDRIYSYLAMR